MANRVREKVSEMALSEVPMATVALSRISGWPQLPRVAFARSSKGALLSPSGPLPKTYKAAAATLK